MKVEVVKGLVLVTLFVMTFILGVIPVILMRIFRRGSENLHKQLCYKRILSFLSCFAAGVFLATGVLDLLPSVRNDLGSVLYGMNIVTAFPIAEFVMMFGLFLILIIEQVVISVKEKHMQDALGDAARTPLLKPTNNEPGNSRKKVARPVLRRAFSHSVTSEHSISGIRDDPLQSSGCFTDDHNFEHHQQQSYQHQHHHGHTHHAGHDDIEQDLDETEHIHALPEHEHSRLRSFLLLTALSLHSIFEGLAVGLQKKSEDVLGIFAALVVHKSVLSFSLGMNLVQSKLSYGGVMRSVLFFSLTAPVGVGIGLAITDLWDSNTSTLVQGILTGIACGTFLYVTFFEVLPAEFNCPDVRLLKVLFLLMGFAAVTGILFIHQDSNPTCSFGNKNN